MAAEKSFLRSVRIGEIDALKGIGIILMIMGHQFYGNHFDMWIHAFHMPLFFLVSGFLYRKPETISMGVMKKVRTLVIPYLFFGMVHLAIVGIRYLCLGGDAKDFARFVSHLVFYNTEGLPICGAIWFLTALFFATITCYILDFTIINRFLKFSCIVIINFIGIILPYFSIRLPWSLDISFVGVGFIYVGVLFRKLYEKVVISENKCLIIGLFGCIIGSLLIQVNKPVNMRLAVYGQVVLFYVNAIVLTVALFLLVHGLKNRIKWIDMELSFVGRNSIVYLGFNQLVLIFAKKVDVEANVLLRTMVKLFMLIVVIGILHYIAELLTKSRIKRLIGR